jgi:hypothetical protein
MRALLPAETMDLVASKPVLQALRWILSLAERFPTPAQSAAGTAEMAWILAPAEK